MNMKSRVYNSYQVYLIKCSDGTYYTGVTNDVDRRFYEHNEGIDKRSYTFKRRPLTLVYVEEYTDIEQAIEREKQIKKWSQEKKEALVQKNFDKLPGLAECQNQSHSKNKPHHCHLER